MIVAIALAVVATPVTGVRAESDQRDQRAERARHLYQTGITAMNEGNFDLAKTSFREVLRIYPKHPQARAKLIHITSNRNALEIGKRILGVQIERASNKKVTPNFIVQDPTNAFHGRTVTLRLNRIPAETLLRYIADQAGGRIRYDNHAIVITPRRPATKPSTPSGHDALLVE